MYNSTYNPIDPDALMEAVNDSMFGLGNAGFCTACGAEHDGLEPDARNIYCDVCTENNVFGAEELLIMGYA